MMLAETETPQLVWWIMGIIGTVFTGAVLHAATTLSQIKDKLSTLTTKVAVIETDLKNHADHGKEIAHLKERVIVLEASKNEH